MGSTVGIMAVSALHDLLAEGEGAQALSRWSLSSEELLAWTSYLQFVA